MGRRAHIVALVLVAVFCFYIGHGSFHRPSPKTEELKIIGGRGIVTALQRRSTSFDVYREISPRLRNINSADDLMQFRSETNTEVRRALFVRGLLKLANGDLGRIATLLVECPVHDKGAIISGVIEAFSEEEPAILRNQVASALDLASSRNEWGFSTQCLKLLHQSGPNEMQDLSREILKSGGRRTQKLLMNYLVDTPEAFPDLFESPLKWLPDDASRLGFLQRLSTAAGSRGIQLNLDSLGNDSSEDLIFVRENLKVAKLKVSESSALEKLHEVEGLSSSIGSRSVAAQIGKFAGEEAWGEIQDERSAESDAFRAGMLESAWKRDVNQFHAFYITLDPNSRRQHIESLVRSWHLDIGEGFDTQRYAHHEATAAALPERIQNDIQQIVEDQFPTAFSRDEGRDIKNSQLTPPP